MEVENGPERKTMKSTTNIYKQVFFSVPGEFSGVYLLSVPSVQSVRFLTETSVDCSHTLDELAGRNRGRS